MLEIFFSIRRYLEARYRMKKEDLNDPIMNVDVLARPAARARYASKLKGFTNLFALKDLEG